MAQPLVFAAIDIGSNAVRILFTNVFEDSDRTVFKKGSMIRVPIRLGEDAFLTGRISGEKAAMLVKSMRAFKHLMSVHNPVDYVACATSAIRCSENGAAIIEDIYDKTGIRVNVIDGQREAEIIYSNHIAEEMADDRSYLYIEVGGGSTEVTLFAENARVFSRSFRLGTVRILHDLIGKEDWHELRDYLKDGTKGYSPLVAIGSGGNINCVFKLLRKKEGRPVSYAAFNEFYRNLKAHTFDERVKVLGLRPDRADVIIPACEIYLSIMKWTGIRKIYVPKIGLADGMIHLLYEKYRYRTLTGDGTNGHGGEQSKEVDE